MTSKGQVETQKLKQNLEEQLERLVQQLSDIEESKNDLDPEEYEESKTDTLEQLQELNQSLSKLLCGDMTLVDQLSSMQLATQAAISAAFQTPAVIRMFARREPQQLRDRLIVIERDMKLGKMEEKVAVREKVEILSALRHLSEKLSQSELQFLNEHADSKQKMLQQGCKFVQVTEELGVGDKALSLASNEVNTIKKEG